MDDDTRARLGREGTRLIREIEDAIDNAIALQGQLVSFLPLARKDAGLSAVFGQGLFDQSSELLGDLTTARRRAVAAHRSCEAVARYIGYVNAGDPGDNKGPPDASPVPPEMIAPTPLRVVEKRERAA
jgi:hypothetical protein